MKPVSFEYKEGNQDVHVGFIAEDVPEMVATPDRKGLESMDIAAVLTKVVQEQQKMLKAQQEGGVVEVRTVDIIKDGREPIRKYEPDHPDADNPPPDPAGSGSQVHRTKQQPSRAGQRPQASATVASPSTNS